MNKKNIIIVSALLTVALGVSIGVYINSKKRNRLYKDAKKQMQYYLKKTPLRTANIGVATMPEPARSYYLKGKEYYYKNDFDNAINEFQKSINAKPTPQAYCEIAVSHMEKSDFIKAIDYLNKSLALDPKYPKSEYSLAVCFIRIIPPDLKKAREHFERAEKLGYNIPEWFERHLRKLEGEH